MTRHIETRPWRAGDTARCAYAKRAPALLPCGEPVTVQEYEFDVVTHLGPKVRRQTKAVCTNHAYGRLSGARVREAEHAAQADLLATHAAEYRDRVRYHLALDDIPGDTT